MAFLDIASGNSLWRGVDYFHEKKVRSVEPKGVGEYSAEVSGSGSEIYHVEIDIKHPKRSTCNCKFAEGRRVICKHMVAAYFTVFPEEEVRIQREAQEAEKEYEQYLSDTYDRAMKRIDTMKAAELRSALKEVLNLAPDWVYERFVRDHVGW